MVNAIGNNSNDTTTEFSPSPAIYVLVVVVILTTIASVLGNILVQAAFWSTIYLKASSPAILVMLLAVVDLCMALFVMPFVVTIALHDRWVLTHGLCVASGFMNTLLTALQFGVLFSISINRFAAVSYPHRYQVKWTTKLTYTMMVIVFGHCLLWSVMPFLGWGGYDFIQGTLYCNINWSEHKSHSTSLFVFCYIIPAFIAAVIYITVYIKIRKMAKSSAARMRGSQNDIRAVKNSRDEESSSDIHGRSVTEGSFTMNMKGKKLYESKTSVNRVRRYTSRESRVTKSLLLVAIAFAIFWLPRGLVNFWAVVSGRESVPKSLEYLTTIFIFMNSFVNPIIYGLFHYEYNKAFRHILRCGKRCVMGGISL